MVIPVGRVKDAHGIKGEIFVRVDSGDTSWLEKLQTVQIRKDGRLVQYQPIRGRRHKGGIVFQFKEITDRNQAEALKGYEFLLPEELLTSNEGEAIYLREILGFAVWDEKLGFVGEIQGFSSNGPQDLLIVNYQDQECLIPFVKDFVQTMNFAEKKLMLHLPEGLLEVAR